MRTVVRWLFGVESSPQWVAGGDWSMQFQSTPHGPWAVLSIVAAVAAVACVWLMYRREPQSIPPRSRILLASLRLLALGCVVLMLSEAVVVINKKEPIPSQLILLVDSTQSMGLKDVYRDHDAVPSIAAGTNFSPGDGDSTASELAEFSRLELAQHALRQVTSDLERDHLVSYYAFAGELQPLNKVDELYELKANGRRTSIGSAMEQALSKHRGQPLAGILLVTDGQSNSGSDPLQIARDAVSHGAPIHVLAVGSPDGPRNAKIAQLEVDPINLAGEEMRIPVLIESVGLEGTASTVTLEQRPPSGAWQELVRRELTLGKEGSQQRTTFQFTPETVGPFEFRARISGVDGELSDADNVAVATSQVIRQQLRVLLFAGYPHPEVQFLQAALHRDPGIELAAWLQTSEESFRLIGEPWLRRLPATQQELDRFDVLILFDPDMQQAGPVWPEMVRRFVGDTGGGLVYVAGEIHAPKLFDTAMSVPFESADPSAARWLDMLPVVRQVGLYRSEADVPLQPGETWHLELTPQGKQDPVFQLASDRALSEGFFARLSGMYWHFPVTRAKAGATVLARHGDPRMRSSAGRHVVVATQLYGPGRTVFLAFDSTYRWRYTHEDAFNRFWARLVERVGRNKLLGGRHPLAVTSDQAEYAIGDDVALSASFVHSADAVSAPSRLSGQLELGGEPPIPLTFEPVGGTPGVFRASFVAETAGPALVRILPSEDSALDGGPRAATLALRIEPPQREFDRPNLNRPLLEELANATGGHVFSLAQTHDLRGAFPAREVERILEYRDEVWDAPLLFGALFLLLSSEWLLRKRYRMA